MRKFVKGVGATLQDSETKKAAGDLETEFKEKEEEMSGNSLDGATAPER